MPHRILVVDDEPDVRLVLGDLFGSRGYQVTDLPDGQTALDALRATGKEGRPDLILADYQMPGLNGIAFLKAAYEVAPETIRILLTAHGDLQVAVAAINEAHVYKFITKPWNNNDLLLTIRRALEHYDLIRQNRAFADMLEMMVDENVQEIERLRDALKDMAARIRSLLP